MEFGRVYNAQLELTNAAREGVRVMAIQNNVAAARGATIAAASTLNPALGAAQIAVVSSAANPAACGPNATVTLTATYPVTFITGLFGPTITLTGRSTMQCGG
jgi:Flp pilus assembly protein TadG